MTVDISELAENWTRGLKSDVADKLLNTNKETAGKILRAFKHYNTEIYAEIVDFLIFNRIFI